MSVESELQRAEELLRAGYKTQAQTRLARLLKQDFHNEQAWWLLAQSQDDPQRRKDCLERVLAINPGNQAARQMLAALTAPTAPPPAPPSTPVASFKPPQFADSPTRAAPEPVKFSSLLNPLTAPSEPEAPARTEAEAEEVAADRLSFFEREPEPEPAESQYSYRYKNTWQPPDEAESDGAASPEALAPAAPPDPARARQELERAIALIEKGQREEGRAILETLVEADPKNETAWLWLAAITRDREMKLGYLDKALAANPQSKAGRKMLAEMGVRVEADGAVARGAGVSLPWYEVWLTALTRPNPQSYEVLLGDPEVGISRALIWAALTGLVAGALAILAQALIFNSLLAGLRPAQLGALDPNTFTAILFLCGLPAFAVSAMLGVLLSAGFTHLGARLFGGNRPLAEQVYLTAAYGSPIFVVSASLAFIPLVNCLTLPLGLYALFLNIVAVKAINRFGWGAATFAGLLPVLVGLGLSVCTWAILFAAAGSGAFDELLRQLLLPAPGAP